MSKNSKRKHAPRFLHSRMISVVSISMVLFLVGIVTMIGLVGNGLKDYVRESFSFTVILTPESSDAELAKMQGQIEQKRFVKEVTFYSKEQAMQELQKELGENPEDFLGWNPLSPAFEVQVKSDYVVHPDSISLVERELNAFPLTQSVNYRKDIVKELNDNIRTITIVMVVVMALLLMISIVLINNTIRLLIYSKRFTIYTMRLVGATSGFIRRPFIRSSVWSGVLAAIIAIALLAWAWYHMITVYPLMRTVLTPLNGAIVAGVVLLIGVILSWIAASAAVTRYLRMNADKLYRA